MKAINLLTWREGETLEDFRRSWLEEPRHFFTELLHLLA